MKLTNLIIACVSMWTAVAVAGPVSIYNTGVDNGGHVLANGAAEMHYQLVSTPDNSTTEVRVLSEGEYPVNCCWVGDSPRSLWATPNQAFGAGPGGTYDYRLTFFLDTTVDAVLSGVFAADDMATISLNGVDTGNVAYGFSTMQNFIINSGFQVGMNTLDFIVFNSGPNPTGLRVEADNATVPEPASLALLGLGLFGVAAMRRKQH